MNDKAKILYGILLSRNSLSKKNGWVDNEGRVFFYYKRTDAEEELSISNKTAVKLFAELVKYDLLEEVPQGFNRPKILYLLRFELSTG